MAANDLVTFAMAKEYLKIDDSQSIITGFLISAISDRVEAITGRNIKAADYTEYKDGTGDSYIILNNYPVNTITSICIDTERAFPAGNNVASTDYYLNTATGIIELYHIYTTLGKKIIKVIYNAGFATVPEDLQQAVFEALDWNLKRFEGSSIGMDQQSAGGVSARPSLTLPASSYNVIMSYRGQNV